MAPSIISTDGSQIDKRTEERHSLSTTNLDNLATVLKDGLSVFVGTVSSRVLASIRGALLFALGFDG